MPAQLVWLMPHMHLEATILMSRATAAINSVPQGAVLDFGGPTQKYLISARLVLRPGIARDQNNRPDYRVNQETIFRNN